MLKHYVRPLILTSVISSLLACQSTTTQVSTNQQTPNVNQVQQQAYNGAKARIAVARFTDQSNNSHWWSKEIGNGMSDQLTTALVGTNRFIVLERQALDAVLSEQDLVTAGRVSRQSGAAFGEIEGAEIVIIASVTEFDDNASGASLGGGGFMGDMMKSVSAGFSNTHMAIDLRLIDTRTSRILAATTVEGGSKDFDLTAAATNFGSSIVGGGLSAWSNTPKEKALREVIQKAVEYTLTKIPDVYYRYDQNNTLLAGATAPTPIKHQKNVAKLDGKSTSEHEQSSKGSLANPFDKVKISMVQAQLNCLGYLSDQESEGVLTPNTIRALERFQKDASIEVTGTIDDETNGALADSGCLNNSIQSGFGMIANAFAGVATNTDMADEFLYEAYRAPNDFGHLSIEHEPSGSGMTEIEVIAQHQESGSELKQATGSIFKVQSNGELHQRPDFLKNGVTEPVNSGRYYLKFAAMDKFFASGDVILKRGVKNKIRVELE